MYAYNEKNLLIEISPYYLAGRSQWLCASRTLIDLSLEEIRSNQVGNMAGVNTGAVYGKYFQPISKMHSEQSMLLLGS